MSTVNGKITRIYSIGFILVMIKAILYERTVVVCVIMDFERGVGRSEPCGDSRWSRWRKEL